MSEHVFHRENHGGISYSYDADSFLTERGDNEFTYSVGGELLAVNIDGSADPIEYAYDGLRAHVAQRIDQERDP